MPVMPVQAEPVARCQQEVSSQPWAALALNSALTQQAAGRLEFVWLASALVLPASVRREASALLPNQLWPVARWLQQAVQEQPASASPVLQSLVPAT